MERYKQFTERILKQLHPSLRIFIFEDLDGDGKISFSDASEQLEYRDLLKMGSIICRFSGLILLALCLAYKLEHKEKMIPENILDIFEQVWAGTFPLSEGLCLSILKNLYQENANETTSPWLVKDKNILVNWSDYINYKSWSYKRFDRTLESNDVNFYELFEKLVSSIIILRKTRYINNNKSGYFEFSVEKYSELNSEKSGKVKIKSSLFFLYSKQVGRPCYLYSINMSKNIPSAVYAEPDSGYNETIEIIEEPRSYLDVPINIINEERKNQPYERVIYLFGNDYEYIQNIANAIVETECESCRATFKDIKEKNKAKETNFNGLVPDIDKYKKFDRQIRKRIDIDYMVLLLAENGPQKILDEFISGAVGKKVLNGYLEYFEKNGRGSRNKWVFEMEEKINNYLNKINELVGSLDKGTHSRYKDKYTKSARVWCLMNAAGFKKSQHVDYVESISLRTRWIRQWNINWQNDPNEDNIKAIYTKINWLIERTFKFLIAFYTGIIFYAKCLKNGNSDYEEIESAFYDGVRKKCEEFEKSPSTAGWLVEKFKELINDTELLNAIYLVAGRRCVCNKRELNRLTNEKWIATINCNKHDKKNYHIYSDEFMLKFMENTIELFKYLQYGVKDFDCEKRLLSTTPIYPRVISFREVRRKRKGMLIYSYEMKHSTSMNINNKPKVNILTPLGHKTDEEYYCLPNQQRSTTKWWIDPLLISCRKIDSIFDKKCNNDNR